MGMHYNKMQSVTCLGNDKMIFPSVLSSIVNKLKSSLMI